MRFALDAAPAPGGMSEVRSGPERAADEDLVLRTQEAFALEDLALDEAPDMMTAMALPELRCYLDDDEEDRELGLRALLENPEALSRSLRHELQ